MTERTIRSYAKELAGAFYEGKRTGRFRDGVDLVLADQVIVQDGVEVSKRVQVPFNIAYPNAAAFVAGWWPAFVPLAKRQLAAMLGMPDERVSPLMKERISAALIEEGEKEAENKARAAHKLSKGLELPQAWR